MQVDSKSVSPEQDTRYSNRKKSYAQEISKLFAVIVKRVDENSIEALRKFIPIDEIIFEINQVEPTVLIQYIKQIVFYLSRVKMEHEEKLNRLQDEDGQHNYEAIIQKLEADVRIHIRVPESIIYMIEQQQRLHIETLQQKVDDLTASIVRLERQLRQKDIEHNNLISQRLKKMEDHDRPILPSTSNPSSVPSFQRKNSGGAADRLTELMTASKKSNSRVNSVMSQRSRIDTVDRTNKHSGALTNRTTTEAEMVRQELARMQQQAYLSVRDHPMQEQLKKVLAIQKHTNKSLVKEQSKSSSLDGANKVLRSYKRELKSSQQILASQKQLQQVLRKKKVL